MDRLLHVPDQDKSALQSIDVVSTIETWWGATLDDTLVNHMLAAPLEHLAEFFEFLLDSDHESLAPASKGVLRPLIIDSVADATLSEHRYDYLSRVPTLSLYAHETLVSIPRIFSSDFKADVDLQNLSSVLMHITAMKPLIKEGAVRFCLDPNEIKNRHPSRSLLTKSALEESDDPEVIEAFIQLSSFMDTLDVETAKWLWFSAGNEASYILRTASENPRCFNICKHGDVTSLLLDLVLAMSGITKADRGTQNLNRLLALRVPAIAGMAEQVASLRSHSDEFAEWRIRLAAALSVIDDIEKSNESWAADARAALTEELSPISERLKKEVAKSPAMRAVTSGMRTFSLAGVGTIVSGLLGGPVAVPAASLAAAKAVEAVNTFIDARRQSRANRAVLDLIMAFEPERD